MVDEVDVRAAADVEDVVLVGDAPLATADVEEMLADVDEPEADVVAVLEVDVPELDEDEDPAWLSRDGMPANVMPAAEARTSLRAAAAPEVVK